jgi:hydrogenase maturation factor
MIIGVKKEKLSILEESFKKEKIEYSVIGELTNASSKLLINKFGTHEIEPPESDELYKVI